MPSNCCHRRWPIKPAAATLDYLEKVRLQPPSLRHYTVLLCIRLFESTAKTTSSETKAVAASSAMLPLVTAQTVAFDRGFGGRISRGRTHARQAQAARRRTRTRPGKYRDGDGLYLVVASPTSKNWSYRYWKDRKQRWLGLGSHKDVSLKDARLARDAARLRVKGDRSTPGVDIVQEKRAARQEAKVTELKLNLPTFEECAEIYIRERRLTWSKKHRDQWPSSLKRYAYATIGKLTIPEIKPSHIYELLRPIWVEKRETANRVRGRIETIIAKNINVDDTDFRNPAELTKQLREKLPRRPKRVVPRETAPLTHASRSRSVAHASQPLFIDEPDPR
jgi:Arm DNA-binding domain